MRFLATQVFKLDPAAVQWRIVEDEVVALDLRTSRFFAVNKTGRLLWALLAGGASGAALRDELVRVWDIDPQVAERDVASFIKRLRSDALLLPNVAMTTATDSEPV
jgi:hypothetical protein